MNILMMSNTYTPIVGGLERSIGIFSSEYRARGHRTLIVAPVFKNMPANEEGVYRIPAIQNFNGTDFSVEIPFDLNLKAVLNDFRPDIVHSHHPFLVGDTALRVAAGFGIPIIFTHHTMYEMNTHYVPGDSPALARFVRELATGYANLCDRVIAPSRSVEAILRERGVAAGIVTIPTGIPLQTFEEGDGAAFRRRFGIPAGAFVAGYLGRLSEEKNLYFLAEAVIAFMRSRAGAHLLIVGDGELRKPLEEKMAAAGLGSRCHFTGFLRGHDEVSAYHAMDVFAFASRSETQGLVLAEAMAAGTPVVGLDATGVRDVISHGVNGYLVGDEEPPAFARALEAVACFGDAEKRSFAAAARETAAGFDYRENAGRTLAVYEELAARKRVRKDLDTRALAAAKRSIKKELDIVSNIVNSARSALSPDGQ